MPEGAPSRPFFACGLGYSAACKAEPGLVSG